MDGIIKKANFIHDKEEEKEKFTDEIDEWYSSNEETCSSADGVKALKALGTALTSGKVPAHDTEGWKQAVSAYEAVQRMTIDLKDAGKMNEKDLKDAYFNFILQLGSGKLASIHLKIIKEALSESDIGLQDYIKTLPNDKVKLLLDILKKSPIEEPGKNEDIYEKFYYFLSEISDALSKEQNANFEPQLADCSLCLLLDFTHLDKDSLEHVVDASSKIMRNMDDPWQKTTDVAPVRELISKLKAFFVKSPNTPEKLQRPIREFIQDMRKGMEKRGSVELTLDFHDLALAISNSKIKDKKFLQDCFNASILFFRDLPEESLKKNSALFRDLVLKFKEGLDQIGREFMEEYPLRVVNALKKMFPKNKEHSELWFQLLPPLLKLPYVESMDAANDVVSAAKGMEWKGKTDLADQVFRVAETVQIPEFQDVTDVTKRQKKRESFAKYYKYFLKDFMEGLKRAKLITKFGKRALLLCTNLLKISGDFEELQGLVEDVSEKIDVDLTDPESKEAMTNTMKAICEISKNPDYPWVDCWYFERAVKELVRSCVRPIKDPRVLTDKDLTVYISMCEEALHHDVLDPNTGQFSSQHYTIFMETMDGVSNWLKTLDKYGLAKNLFDQIMTTYDTEEPIVFTLNSRYFSDASETASGLKIIAPHLDKLFELLVETENPDLVRTLMQAYPANPKSITKHMPALMNVFMKSIDSSVISYFSMMLNQVAKSAPEAFTEENSKQLLDKCQDRSKQSTILQVVQELCKRRPDIMVTHMSTFMDKSKWESMLKSWINDMIATLALYDEKLAPTAVDFLLEEARVEQDKSSLLSSLNAARQVGFKYKDLIKARREKVEQLQLADPDAQNLKQITLDMIDGKTSEELMKQFEEQQANIAGLVGRVDETQEAVAELKDEMGRQGQDLDTVKKDVNLHGQRLDQVEETVEETVAKVEEIDQKTLSHSPYWSRDVAKLLNPATEHDWRLLSSRLGYSNDDIRAWAQQADPCMAMLNEWYATRKTSEATMAILTQLQEMNRQDAAIIVENAMKNAEKVVEDEDFEYAEPPPVFISYQWGHQPEARLLQKHLEMAGYKCWLDLGQMGGGDKLFEKIDNGIRAAKVIISCVTEKYAKSPNCNREVNLSVSLRKAMIPLLMEKCTWPPPGSMGPIFSEYLFIRFFQRAGEELTDDRYWPVDKFQELLMQLDVMGLAPDETQIDPVYRDWWMPKVQEIKIDKSKTKNGGQPKTDTADLDKTAATSPDVFISYQWGKQKNIIQLYERLTGLGLTCWLDIKQMGGGDSLYDKIDRGVRGCRVVVSCVTQKYALSPNCRREVSLADALKKPLVPLLLESMQWPPAGPMSMAFTQLLYIDFTKDEGEQMSWRGAKSQELIDKLSEHMPLVDQPSNTGSDSGKAVQRGSPNPRQPTSGEPTGNKQEPKQKQDQGKELTPSEQQQKPTTKTTQPQQQQEQPITATQQQQPTGPQKQQEAKQQTPAQKQPSASDPMPNQPLQENKQKSKSCAII
ncbi:hypothetical protein EGW08_015656 [Elysia chlorotica]|uniref:Uncharacterized protein n=1 Tax=Elysia chlorotica TaxID=188477 RepID=A0A433T4U3_ELYCH|nr:hypothetical protein EGW08_015656 [Elysia chlorotica]